MNQKISPAVVVAIIVLIVAAIGFVGWKVVTTPQGTAVSGKIPASAGNPNGDSPPPAGAITGGGGGPTMPGGAK